MNTTPPFAGSPALKLSRRPAVAPTPTDTNPGFGSEMSGQLAADLEALREREMNLRDYENRLRVWQTQLDQAATKTTSMSGSSSPFLRPSSAAPFSSDATLEAAWEKFYRARALLETEQTHLRDERIALRDLELALRRREADLAAREAQVAAREQQLATQSAPERDRGSAMQRLTQAPFLAAKAVFRGR